MGNKLNTYNKFTIFRKRNILNSLIGYTRVLYEETCYLIKLRHPLPPTVKTEIRRQ